MKHNEKNKIYILMLSIISFSELSYAQPDWNTQGNLGTNILTDFVGTTENTSLQFGTNNIFPLVLV